MLAATIPFWDLGRPLLEVDDARYASIPRDMALSGDWVTPTLAGMPYVEKPPLWYWICAASYKAFGVSEAAAHLPLALLSLLGLSGVFWLGSWLYGRRVGLTAALALGTSLLFVFQSQYITPDLPLTVFLLWCSGLMLRAMLRPQDARWAAPLAWLCAALAFLSKGLVALVFPVGWALGLWLLFPAARPGLLALLRPSGPALFLLTAGPWFAAMAARHPGFLRFFFGEQHFQRFLNAGQYGRSSPWFFFLLVVPAGLLPWTPAVLAGFSAAWKEWKAKDLRAPALALWSVMIIVFFSKSQSKLAPYSLPVFPQLALLAAVGLEYAPPAFSRRAAIVLGGALLTAAAFFLPTRALLPESSLPPTIVMACGETALAVLGAGLLAAGLFRERPSMKLGAAGLGTALLIVLALRNAGEFLSLRSLGQALERKARAGDVVYAYDFYPHGLTFYSGHKVDRVLNWVGELKHGLRDPRNADRFGDDDELRALPPAGKSGFVVLKRSQAVHMKALVPARKIFSYEAFGPWLLLEIREPATSPAPRR